MALLSVAGLLVLLAALVAYQTFLMAPLSETPPEPTAPGATTPAPESPAEVPPVSAEANTPPEAVAPEEMIRPDSLVYPLVGTPRVLKAFESVDSAYGDYRQYTAMALQAKAGDSVLAAAKGIVTTVERDPAEGVVLALDHGGGLSTEYSGLGAVQVSPGATVEAGAVVGQVGEPGPIRRAMGSHLAFTVRVNGNPVNPLTLLKQ